jgi:uncharacterized glyoxalase superfamily protein PhnB
MRLRTLSPIFQVADMERAIAFYRDVLGFDVGWSVGEPARLASLCRDGLEIVLELSAQPVPSHVYIAMDGVDDYFAGITSVGAREVVPLADREYGMRDGRVADPDGNQLGLGEPLQRD